MHFIHKLRIIIEGKHYHANMASIDYEQKLLAILSISFFLSCIFVSSTGLVAALDPALLASEGKALLESGWWSDYSHLTSHRCKWTGIVCDRAGSITEISPPPEFLKVGNIHVFSSQVLSSNEISRCISIVDTVS